MKKHESEYQKLLMERYGSLALNKLDKTALRALYNDPGEDGYEEEMLEFLNMHPNASLQELIDYDFSFYSPIEIVEDNNIDIGSE